MGIPQDSSGAGQWRAVSTGAQRGLDAFISGSIPHPGDVSEPTSGPPITQESVNLAETICSTSDNVLYVTYPPWRRAQAGLVDLPVIWSGEIRRTVPLPSTAFDATGTPSLPKILAGLMQAHEVEALRYVLNHTEGRMGALGYRPVLLLHDEVVWEGPAHRSDAAKVTAHTLMIEALAGVTRGIPAQATVEARVAWSSRN